MRQSIPIVLILAGFLLVASLYALQTPDWQAPDEPAHYNYVRQLAGGEFPVISPDDYDQDYQNMVVSSRFDRRYSVEPFEYEDHQPPLYYLIQTPVFLASGGALRPLRMVSVILGAGVVLLSYLIARRLFPGIEWLALTAAGFVAFLPQHVAMMAAVNNDSLAELLIAATLLLLGGIVAAQEGKGAGGEGIREWPRKWLLLGLMLGLGFLTKATVYILVPLIGIVLLWRYWGQWPMLWRSAILVFGPAALLGLLWWGRNAFVYGGTDILGTAAHNAVVVGQPRTSEWIAERGVRSTIAALARTTFQSFWGQFGWMGVVMPNWVYQPLLLFSLLALVGLLFAFAANRRSLQRGGFDVLGDVRAPALLILAGTLALSMLLFLGYNVTFVQHQGRYLFPALIPIAIGVSAGWGFWLSPASRRWPNAAYILPIVLCLSLFALDLLALYRFIVPSLS